MSLSPPPPSSLLFLFVCLFLLSIFTEPLCSSQSLTNSSSSGHPRRRSSNHRQLSVDYYSKSCPDIENLVGAVTSQQFKLTPVSAPATINLFFHDCFVEGCDASILVASKGGGKAEKEAEQNRDLREEGFETVRKAKELVESKCPGVVSCADILAIAARDFVHLAGGPYYQVKKGRWDGKISMASRVGNNLPHANSTVDQLIKLFTSKGLTLEEMVALSGAHTIGFAHCNHFVTRLYNYQARGQPDPNMDPKLMYALRMYCPSYGGSDAVVPFDATTPFLFDHAYYGNLQKKMGLLASDQALFSDPRTKLLVEALAKDKQKFFQAFASAMERMSLVKVKRGKKHGEKRRDCSIHV
ncbi:peroxidase 19-like [Prosopis cineraria]|uniref:peroxidase 19-like n=1 Tax=Prosopis cineraria TaxID=364024 RepID=UPI00241082CC|nr:peroxidase 19-like [Prosopis cineraria]